MKCLLKLVLLALFFVSCSASSRAQEPAEKISSGNPFSKMTIPAVEHDRANVVVTFSIEAKKFKNASVELTDKEGNIYQGQIAVPSIHDVEGGNRVTFVVPRMAKGSTLEIVKIESVPYSPNRFVWSTLEEGVARLLYGSRPVMSYMHSPLDESTKEQRQKTYKVYHHVYTPDGSRLMTKGPGGLFPHHRGLFYGFNLIRYGDGKTADVWHCKESAHQSHFNSLAMVAGAVFGRDVNIVNWHGKDGDVFATEYREMTAYLITGGTMIDFRSRLETNVGTVSLKGDPQHAGFQFRASQDVPDMTKKLTYYVRPDGKAEPGDFRNWSDKKDETSINKNHFNLPFNAACITLPCLVESGGKKENRKFTVCYFDHPNNPKPSRYSERDYARFGSYFEYELTEDRPLNVRYRIWIQEGEMSVEEIKRLSDAFVLTK